MRVMAQIAMVMNLDKCIGCHTCSVTCKQAWTNREGTEYIWFNNVETRPGVGYPRTWEDQEKWKGGWNRTANGGLKPKAGGRLSKLLHIFSNPDMPGMDSYYEPWTYEYDKLLSAPAGSKALPVARAKSQVSGEHIDTISWGPNWDDDLGGSAEILPDDPVARKAGLRIKTDIESSFMFYLPRICNHCLNPTCVASCPSGAMYKRTEDGIVLVDQDKCRGWRMCVSGCPYKKVYFNHQTGKAEKCTLCYPRLEIGQPTVCSETCVGRLRYLGVLLYDADRVSQAAAAENEQDLYQAQLDVMLNPFDPEVIAGAQLSGIPDTWISAAQQSPVYELIKTYQVALPLHPEYRTLPMVWYVPPLSPLVEEVTAAGLDGEDHRILLTAVSQMRIPIEYLAGLLTAGDEGLVERVLRKLCAMRSHMREVRLEESVNPEIAASVGMSGEELEKMYRLLAIAKFDDRYVIPTAQTMLPRGIMELEGHEEAAQALGIGAPDGCSISYEALRAARERAQGPDSPFMPQGTGRINLLTWDGDVADAIPERSDVGVS